MIEQTQNILSHIHKSDKEKLDAIQQLIEEYQNESNNIVFESTQDLLTKIENKKKSLKNGSTLLKTGFEDFDNQFGGVHLGEYIIIGGRPGMGKTLFAVNWALQLPVETKCLFVSLDCNSESLLARFLAAITRIDVQKILNNELSQIEQVCVEEAKKQLIAKNIYFNFDLSIDFEISIEKLIEFIKEHDIQVIFIDYLQLLNCKNKRNREAEVAYINKKLQKLSKQMNITIIALSQLSRAVETRGGDKKPFLSDLRESGSIEEEADKIIFLYRAEYYRITEDESGESTEGVMELLLEKNKIGKTGLAKVYANQNFTSFSHKPFILENLDIIKERLSELE